VTRRFSKFQQHGQSPVMNADALSLLLRDGDLVFISVINPLFKHVASATHSRATHVGIAFFDETRGWLIAESTVPFAKFTPLHKYLRRSHDRWVAVKRVHQDLNADQVTSLRRVSEKHMGRIYDFGFNYDSKKLFCSKFVFDVYRETLGLEIGSIQSFENLLQPETNQSLAFWKFWFFGAIPWSRRTVTPASQLDDSSLFSVA